MCTTATGGAGRLHAPDSVRRRTRDHPPGPQGSDADPHDSRPDLRPDDRHGRGAPTDLFVGRQSRRRLAAPPARRGGARLAATARNRRAQPRAPWPTPTKPARPACRAPSFADIAARDLPAVNPRYPVRDVPVHRRGTGVHSGAPSRCHHHSRAEGRPRGQRADRRHRRRAEGGGAGRAPRRRDGGGDRGRFRPAQSPTR